MFLAPLLLMMAGYVLLFVTLWMVRIRTEILERRAHSLDAEGRAMNFDMGPYGAFIWPAYGVSALALAGITLWSWMPLAAGQGETGRAGEEEVKSRLVYILPIAGLCGAGLLHVQGPVGPSRPTRFRRR